MQLMDGKWWILAIMMIKGWINIIHPHIRLICNHMPPLMIDFEGIGGHVPLNSPRLKSSHLWCGKLVISLK